MSEDVDLTIPGVATKYGSTNSTQLNRVVRSLSKIGDGVGVGLVNFEGQRSEKGAHGIWEVRYDSFFLPAESAIITVEAAIRPLHLAPRHTVLRQLIPQSLLSGYDEARCWALDFAEVRAEKVRAAFTRDVPQIRDFYDLHLLAKSGADMTSDKFRSLVDAKLTETGAQPLAAQPRSFGLTDARRAAMEAGHKVLEGVVRIGESSFHIQEVLDYYDQVWDKGRAS